MYRGITVNLLKNMYSSGEQAQASDSQIRENRHCALEGQETDSSHRLHKLLEHSRAADDTTFGVQLFADAILTVP